MTFHRQVFHEGERRVQARAGVPGSYVDQVAPYVRGKMPDQHVAFFESLPVLFLGVPDKQGWPWAIVAFDAPGELCEVSPNEMVIRKTPPLAKILDLEIEPGAKLGLLGLDMSSRRRNRLNGTVLSHDEHGVRLSVDQSFGNCPQYIQQREVDWQSGTARAPTSHAVSITSSFSKRLLAQADTFFIATRAAELDAASHNGVDVSHRGGKPGFLHLNPDGSLSFPDFAGNRFFNTLGNIEQDSRISLLIPDFASGEALVLKGRARVDWNPQRAALIEGAERIVDVVPEQVLHVRDVLPAQARLIELSPSLAQTGEWPRSATLPQIFRRLRVTRKIKESASITSFHLTPIAPEAETVEAYRAGQSLTLRLSSTPSQPLTSGSIPVMRSYSLSQAWHGDLTGYRISVRRDPQGVASRLLHDELLVGDVIEALPPTGDFRLQAASAPIVLLSSGVGITPMIAMLEERIRQVTAGDTEPHEVFFVHVARDDEEQAFADELEAWAHKHSWLHLHIAHSRSPASATSSSRHHSRGRLALSSLMHWLPDMAHSHVYLCGSEGFMRAQYATLMALGLPREQLHHEFFGQGSLDSEAPFGDGASSLHTLPERAEVTFIPRAQRGRPLPREVATIAEWLPEKGTLLELAEQAGLAPLSSCRSGRCGSCALRLVSGEVQYPVAPHAAIAQGQVLMCRAYPATEQPVVIGLSG